jgi:hypothetical protein
VLNETRWRRVIAIWGRSPNLFRIKQVERFGPDQIHVVCSYGFQGTTSGLPHNPDERTWLFTKHLLAKASSGAYYRPIDPARSESNTEQNETAWP